MKNSKVRDRISPEADRQKSGINALCEELLKKRPNQKLVESLMRDHGIPFDKDPLLQIGAVLESLNQCSDDVKMKGSPPDETSSF